MRQKWAETWFKWLTLGGELVTLMFPVEPEGREGPPWPVPTQLYDDMLKPAGWAFAPTTALVVAHISILRQDLRKHRFLFLSVPNVGPCLLAFGTEPDLH